MQLFSRISIKIRWRMLVLSLFVAWVAIPECSSFQTPPVFGKRRRPYRHIASATPGVYEPQTKTYPGSSRCDDEDSLAAVGRYTVDALRHCDNEKGLQALHKLGELCRRRTPYNFDEDSLRFFNNSDDPIVRLFPGFLPAAAVEEIMFQLQTMVAQGCWMTNPDSVDGLPSFHLNLISDGKPVISDQEANSDATCRSLRRLIDLVEPHLYNNLLPRARKLLNSSSLTVQEVFLRRYGEDFIDGQSRSSLSAHYDVFSELTAVCALDNTAMQGTNGLYTTALSKGSGLMGSTSNHAALRRYFPLSTGDAVLHSWNVLHGVDIQSHVTRTSLIVWFASKEEASENAPLTSGSPAPHWLAKRKDIATNDVAQFVLASALSSASMETTNHAGLGSGAPIPSELYFQSASMGNAFGLTQLGSLCEDETLNTSMLASVVKLLKDMQGVNVDLHRIIVSDAATQELNLAKRCWLEGAIRGNPNAQVSLADELMLEGTQLDDRSRRRLAATLFGLAAQQGHEAALDALARVIQYEAANAGELASNWTLRIAQAACSSFSDQEPVIC